MTRFLQAASILVGALVLCLQPLCLHAFVVPGRIRHFAATKTALFMGNKRKTHRRKRSGSNEVSKARASRRKAAERTKRQDRMGSFIMTELSEILHSGNIKGISEFLDDHLRQRIVVIEVDVSPDIRQARVMVAIRRGEECEIGPGTTGVVEGRRIYSWLVQNSDRIRYTLAKRMSHMKYTPALSFIKADVDAAVDVAELLESLDEDHIRTDLEDFIRSPDGLGHDAAMDMDENMYDDDNNDDDDDDDEWVDEDDEFFGADEGSMMMHEFTESEDETDAIEAEFEAVKDEAEFEEVDEDEADFEAEEDEDEFEDDNEEALSQLDALGQLRDDYSWKDNDDLTEDDFLDFDFGEFADDEDDNGNDDIGDDDGDGSDDNHDDVDEHPGKYGGKWAGFGSVHP